MNVNIKKFDVEMQIKNNGIEIEVDDTQGMHLGDLIVTKTRLIWCEGRTRRNRGKEITWEEFRTVMNSR